MGRKIFVSYKHEDGSVYGDENTARNYVDELIELFEGDEIYKGEGNEDLSKFKDETIKTHLKDKIHDSSITIVLISPKMKDGIRKEKDQWIPWEISYSLKEIERKDKTSHTNAMLAIVLPDNENYYEYFIEDDSCQYCHCRTLKIGTLFQLLKDNMFNIKDPNYNDCHHHDTNNLVYTGESSYIYSVKWENFVSDKDRYLDKATSIRDDRKSYNITKEIEDE